MLEDDYRLWLAAEGKEDRTAGTSISTLRRIERGYGDLDAAFVLDGLEQILADFAYSKADERDGEPNPTRLDIQRDLYNTLSSCRTHLNYYRRFRETLAARRSVNAAVAEAIQAISDDTDPPEAVLSLERDLNMALRRNIAQLEPGLQVVDGGRERSTASGRIDILAEDGQGHPVVIELKAVTAGRDAVAQLLAYMGDFHAEGSKSVRGLLIAPDFDPRAISAARMVPALELKRFSFNFTFAPAG